MVRLHEVYEDAQHVYIVMENCKGGDLETLLEVRSCLNPSYFAPCTPPRATAAQRHRNGCEPQCQCFAK